MSIATVRYESTIVDGSVWAITDERTVDPATGMTRMHGGYRLEPSSNPARNQFGYEHAFSWEEARQMGITIWVEENGAIWCDDAAPAQRQ